MPKNIKEIRLWEDNPKATNKIPLVKIEFTSPCEWTTISIKDLLKILELWIIGEERVYPRSKNCKGRWLLKEEIDKVFKQTPKPEVK